MRRSLRHEQHRFHTQKYDDNIHIRFSLTWTCVQGKSWHKSLQNEWETITSLLFQINGNMIVLNSKANSFDINFTWRIGNNEDGLWNIPNVGKCRMDCTSKNLIILEFKPLSNFIEKFGKMTVRGFFLS